MKVLHINEHLAWAGGVETYLLSLIPELESRGHAQAMCYAKGDAALIDQAVHMEDISLGTRAAEERGERVMHELLDEAMPDLVHLHQVYNIGVIRACLGRLPVVVHAHDYRYVCPASTFYYKRTREECARTAGLGCFPTTLWKHCLSPRPAYALDYFRRVRWFTLQAPHVSAVIAPSEGARSRYLAAGFEPDKVRVLPYFCTLTAGERPRDLPPVPTVLFIGRIRPNKGIDTFMEALGKLPKTTQAVMIGDFTEAARRDVLARAEEYGYSDRLELRDWVERDRIREVFEQATVFAFPSLWPETLGIVGIEALSCGVPTVASDIGGVREWLIPGKTGFLATPGNAAELAQGLEKLLFDESLNREFGVNGQQLIRERYKLEYHLERLLEIYESSVQDHASPLMGAAH